MALGLNNLGLHRTNLAQTGPIRYSWLTARTGPSTQRQEFQRDGVASADKMLMDKILFSDG